MRIFRRRPHPATTPTIGRWVISSTSPRTVLGMIISLSADGFLLTYYTPWEGDDERGGEEHVATFDEVIVLDSDQSVVGALVWMMIRDGRRQRKIDYRLGRAALGESFRSDGMSLDDPKDEALLKHMEFLLRAGRAIEEMHEDEDDGLIHLGLNRCATATELRRAIIDQATRW